MKTILAVALLIVGFSYVTHAHPPTLGTVDQCCGPQPEDIKHYFVGCTNCPSGIPFVIVPAVEGTNGFIITDFVVGTAATTPRQVTLFESGVQITTVWVEAGAAPAISVNFTSGIPVATPSDGIVQGEGRTGLRGRSR